jgi:hypothetical protein
MKFTFKNLCTCGGRFVFSAHGDADFAPATCDKCGNPAYLLDPLSVSVTAERLLYRSKAELENGEYSLSMVIAVMAVESYLTRLFLKFKGMASYAATFNLPTLAEEAIWEKEYPRSGGFSGPAGFISQKLAGTSFDEFVNKNPTAKNIFSSLPNSSNATPTQYFQEELFKRRNRIVHWGFVNSSKADAELCHTIAIALVSVLREMDRSKYANS